MAAIQQPATRQQRIAQIDQEMVFQDKRLKELMALRDKVAKDIPACRGKMIAKAAERERLVEEERVAASKRTAFAVDPQKDPMPGLKAEIAATVRNLKIDPSKIPLR